MSASTLDYARGYVQRGLAVIPVPARAKKPVMKGWELLRLAESELPTHFSDSSNIGILCGVPSGNHVDVDLDVPEAVAAAPELLPATQMVHGRPSNRSSHYWYRLTEPTKTEQFRFAVAGKEPTMLVELRSTGAQTLAPPSKHDKDDECYQWERSKDATPIAPEALRRQVARVAVCALLARQWPGKGSRDAAALALCGMLLRAGWEIEETGHFVQLVARIAQDEEWEDRDKAAATQRKLDAGDQVTGAPTLATLLPDGEAVVRQSRLWLGLKNKPDERNERDERRSEDAPHNSSHSFNSYAVPAYPAPLAQAAYHGIIGELTQAIAPDTEADPVAILMQLLVAFGNAAGRHAHVLAEADQHYTNLFACIVGPTAGGRKGTSWGHVRKLMQKVDPDWLAERVVGGLSSGEGLIHYLRDDADITDKRLTAYQPEFAAVLKVLLRDGNLLSDTLKQAWDGSPLQVMTKQHPERATNTLVSIIGHITPEEAQRYLTTTEAASGFGNRFVWVCVRRAQFLPEGGTVNMERVAPLLERLSGALSFARTMGALARDDDARRLWRSEYRRLSEGRPGLLGAMTARAEAQVMRFALLYALQDRARAVGETHLRAALALWDYALASARYIFGAALGDPVADAILHALRATPAGMTRTDISNLFGRNKSTGEIERALSRLQSLNLVRYESEPTEGRSAERWHAVTN